MKHVSRFCVFLIVVLVLMMGVLTVVAQDDPPVELPVEATPFDGAMTLRLPEGWEVYEERPAGLGIAFSDDPETWLALDEDGVLDDWFALLEITAEDSIISGSTIFGSWQLYLTADHLVADDPEGLVKALIQALPEGVSAVPVEVFTLDGDSVAARTLLYAGEKGQYDYTIQITIVELQEVFLMSMSIVPFDRVEEYQAIEVAMVETLTMDIAALEAIQDAANAGTTAIIPTMTPAVDMSSEPSTEPETGYCEQTVYEGDTLIAIAQRCGHTNLAIIDTIVELNELSDSMSIEPGMVIRVPWPETAEAADADQDQPEDTPEIETHSEAVVNVVWFSADWNPHHGRVMEDVLPELEAEFGAALNVVLIDTDTSAGDELLWAQCEEYELDRCGIPLMFVGEDALLGSGEIADQSTDLIRGALEAGGLPLPDWAADFEGAETPQPTQTPMMLPTWTPVPTATPRN
jgi:hypothetical protein